VHSYARDSLANLVFSIALLFSVTGGYPRNVIVTGFDIKAADFGDIRLLWDCGRSISPISQ